MDADDILAQAKAESSADAGWFGGKKRLEDFMEYFPGDTVPIILNTDLYRMVKFPRGNFDERMKILRVLFCFFTDRIKCIIIEVEQNDPCPAEPIKVVFALPV